jgi:hypothetical protein
MKVKKYESKKKPCVKGLLSSTEVLRQKYRERALIPETYALFLSSAEGSHAGNNLVVSKGEFNLLNYWQKPANSTRLSQ